MFTKFRSYGRFSRTSENGAQISGRIGENFCANWFYRCDRENGPRKLKILVQVASCWISNWVTAPRLQHGWFGQGDSWSEAEVWSKAAGREIWHFQNSHPSHTPSVALSKLSIRQTWLFYLVGYLFSAHLHKKFQLSVSILRASKALQEPEGGVYSDRGCTSVQYVCGSIYSCWL